MAYKLFALISYIEVKILRLLIHYDYGLTSVVRSYLGNPLKLHEKTKNVIRYFCGTKVSIYFKDWMDTGLPYLSGKIFPKVLTTTDA